MKNQLIAAILKADTGNLFADYPSADEVQVFLQEQNLPCVRGIAVRCGILPADDAITNKKLLDARVYFVEGQPVSVLRLHEAGTEKPHQVLVQTELRGITKQQLTSYESLSTADCDFACFDEEAAEKLVARFHRFLGTVKGKKLATE